MICDISSLRPSRPSPSPWSTPVLRAPTGNGIGPAVACSGGHASSALAAKRAKYARHEAKRERHVARDEARQEKATHKVASRHLTRQERVASRNSGRSYSGGSGGMSGMASYYGGGGMTASGARFNPGAMTAAHRTLPFGTRVLVTTCATGRSVTVTINDRGPFVKGRIIDLSTRPRGALGITGAGVARVSVSVVGRG